MSPRILPESAPVGLEPSGFPSPAADYNECGISLDRSLIEHPEATFFFRVQGQARSGDGVFDGDLLIVDRSLNPGPNQLIVAVADGQLVIRRAADLNREDQNELTLWGVVRWTIHRP